MIFFIECLDIFFPIIYNFYFWFLYLNYIWQHMPVKADGMHYDVMLYSLFQYVPTHV